LQTGQRHLGIDVGDEDGLLNALAQLSELVGQAVEALQERLK
jgi:hypothetical protein